MIQKKKITTENQEPIEICISISQIAILIRECPYGSLIDMLKQLWKKYDLSDFKEKIKLFEKRKKIKIEIMDQWDKLENLSYKLNFPTLKTITTSLMSISSQKELEKQQSEIIEKIQNIQSEDVDSDNDKKTLIKLFTSFTNRGFGQKNEEIVVEKYQKITNTTIFDRQKIVIGRIRKATDESPINWFIKGKIDGLSKSANSETILVEIKNRTKTLFKTLKDYEKPQIQCYMKLLGLKKAHLVEHIKEEDTNIISVDFENDYWEQVLHKLKRFISFFYDFLKDTKMQEIVLIKGSYDEEAENTIRKKLEDYLSN